MANDLPDLDQSLSFVVDDGQAIGPIALAEIARSIAAGERSAASYVWWEGEAEWVPFNSDERLVMLLAYSAVDAELVRAGQLDEVDEDVHAVEGVEVEPAVEDVEEFPVVAEPLEAEMAAPTEIYIPVEIVVPAAIEEAAAAFVAPVVIEMAQEAEALEDVDEADDVDEVERADEIVHVETPEEVFAERVIDFRASALVEDEPSLSEIEITENSVLSAVGARLEALASATKHARSSTQLDRAGASRVHNPVNASDGGIDLRSPQHADGVEADSDGPSSDVRSSTLDRQFDSMVRDTIEHERQSEQSERIRELLARACAAAISRQGYSVDRRSELHGHYYLGFECGVDTRRMRLEITPTASVGGVSSQNAHVVMSWGRMAFDIEEALEVVQSQLPVADRRPGTISSDAELDTGSVSTRVELIWAIDDFVGDDYSIDREALELALASTQHALEKRWYELFIPAE